MDIEICVDFFVYCTHTHTHRHTLPCRVLQTPKSVCFPASQSQTSAISAIYILFCYHRMVISTIFPLKFPWDMGSWTGHPWSATRSRSMRSEAPVLRAFGGLGPQGPVGWFGDFHSHGMPWAIPTMDGLYWKILLKYVKMDDWGVPLF